MFGDQLLGGSIDKSFGALKVKGARHSENDFPEKVLPLSYHPSIKLAIRSSPGCGDRGRALNPFSTFLPTWGQNTWS